jgi:hypothetical protein
MVARSVLIFTGMVLMFVVKWSIGANCSTEKFFLIRVLLMIARCQTRRTLWKAQIYILQQAK